MSKRLQVLVEEDELDEIREAAERNQMTVSEWVRQSLREARRQGASGSPATKLAALREATRHSHPTGDIDVILGEIARGRDPEAFE